MRKVLKKKTGLVTVEREKVDEKGSRGLNEKRDRKEGTIVKGRVTETGGAKKLERGKCRGKRKSGKRGVTEKEG